MPKASWGRGFDVPHRSDCSGTDSHVRATQSGLSVGSSPVVNSQMKPAGERKQALAAG